MKGEGGENKENRENKTKKAEAWQDKETCRTEYIRKKTKNNPPFPLTLTPPHRLTPHYTM